MIGGNEMTEQQQACAELARRIGWREGEFAAIWFPPDGNLKRVQADPPDYFTDAAASREFDGVAGGAKRL